MDRGIRLNYDTWLNKTADIDKWYGEPDEEAQAAREKRDDERLDEEMERLREERDANKKNRTQTE